MALKLAYPVYMDIEIHLESVYCTIYLLFAYSLFLQNASHLFLFFFIKDPVTILVKSGEGYCNFMIIMTHPANVYVIVS